MRDNSSIRLFSTYIKEAKKIVFLTGAGISTESGIPDFRSSEGLWTHDKSREELMHINHFNSKPKHFWEVYKDVFKIKIAGDYEPNYGHTFIAELEKLGKKVTVLTQNVDGLHQLAGSTNVLELHGSMRKAICPACIKRKEKHPHLVCEYDLSYIQEHDIPRCAKCNTILKPDTILFGENIKHYNESFSVSLEADLFVTLGTSLEVSPVNMIPLAVKHDLYKDNQNSRSVIVNGTETMMDYVFDITIHDKIGKTLKQVMKEME